MNTGNVSELKVFELEPRLKHPTIFEWFDQLNPGEAFTIINDHDPKPLFYQLLALRGPVFEFNYLENGPEWWKISISRNAEKEETVGKIVAKDIRKAEVFRKLGIDFCCGGKKTVREAAIQAGVEPELVQNALQEVDAVADIKPPAFDKWEPGFLADYIYNQHHVYYYDNKEDILFFARKVAGRHGNDHPELNQLLELVEKLFEELDVHFHKEEKILFPYIKQLSSSDNNARSGQTVFGHIKDPIDMMEIEHETAGDILKEMRSLTEGYQAPDGACNSYRHLYFKLHEFEKDLHQHVHLENNILFPKALDLYNKVKRGE